MNTKKITKEDWEELDFPDKFWHIFGIVKKWTLRAIVLILVCTVAFFGVKFFMPEKAKYDKEKLLSIANNELEQKVKQMEVEREKPTSIPYIPKEDMPPPSLPDAKAPLITTPNADAVALDETRKALLATQASLRDRDKELVEQREDAKKQAEAFADLEKRIKVAEVAMATKDAEAAQAAEAKKARDTEAVTAEADGQGGTDVKVSPGTLKVIYEAYDPVKHKARPDQFKQAVKATVQNEPVFTVKETPDRVRVEGKGLTTARPVLTPKGQPLMNSGFVPKLKDPALKPYILAVWWEAKKEFVEMWFASNAQ